MTSIRVDARPGARSARARTEAKVIVMLLAALFFGGLIWVDWASVAWPSRASMAGAGAIATALVFSAGAATKSSALRRAVCIAANVLFALALAAAFITPAPEIVFHGALLLAFFLSVVRRGWDYTDGKSPFATYP